MRTEVKANLLLEPAEIALHSALSKVKPQADKLFESGDYTASLQALAALKAPVDDFFDNVTPNAVLMHPSDEHLLPFYVAAGAASPGAGVAPARGVRLHDSITYGCLGMDAYAFGASAPRLAEALRAT